MIHCVGIYIYIYIYGYVCVGVGWGGGEGEIDHIYFEYTYFVTKFNMLESLILGLHLDH